MTGVLPFLLFSLSSQSFTHMDAHSSQSFTHTSQGRTQHKDVRTQAEIDDEILLKEHYNRKAGIYPEPEGDPSY